MNQTICGQGKMQELQRRQESRLCQIRLSTTETMMLKLRCATNLHAVYAGSLTHIHYNNAPCHLVNAQRVQRINSLSLCMKHRSTQETVRCIQCQRIQGRNPGVATRISQRAPREDTFRACGTRSGGRVHFSTVRAPFGSFP